MADGAPTGSVGSSPRLRGTPPFLLDPLVMHGISPALAGNTPPKCRRRPRWWDHPRACGEHGLKLTTGGLVAGSSPRLRGTRFRLPPGPACRGIIPALAGNTDDEASLLRSLRDHPRACGEHFTPAGGVQYDRGSSPRLRGTRDGAAGRYSHCGIIPALAGNTSRQPAASNTIGDHPRACGEHVTVPQDAILTAGSSPRLRGTPSASRRSPTVRGSSPRLRGTQRHYTLDYSKVTIIPALAGNTEARTVLDTVQTVSSPRLRGTQDQAGEIGDAPGIIPALAGNTA